jgi:hypothetical protein
LEALEAAGVGSNLGFNYSHLEKQDKESLTEAVIIVAASQLRLTGGAQPIFFPNPRKTSIYNYFLKPNSTRNMLKLLHETIDFPLYLESECICGGSSYSVFHCPNVNQ